jgi:hypothetical protein
MYKNKATGNEEENAQPAIFFFFLYIEWWWRVYFPPGDYTSGTIHLHSHIRIFLEAGATIYSSKDPSSFDKRGLFYGEDIENITIEGHGTVDGQAEYEWRLMDMKDGTGKGTHFFQPRLVACPSHSM